VALHPLDDDAIRRYLAQAGRADLWKAIQLDPDLIDMARSPLLLSFMTGLTDGPEAEPAPRASSVTDRRRRLLDRYVSALTPAAALPQRYRRAQLLTWLRQLATMLKREGRTEFLIEQMQPPWLETRLQRWGYRAGVFTLSALLVAAIVQMSLTLFELVQPGHVGLALRARVPGALAEESSLSTPLLWMFAAVVGAVIASRTSIVPIETLTWSWTAAWTNLRRWSLAGALAGLDYGLALGVAASAIWLIVQLDFANIGSSWETIGQFCGTIGSVVPAAYFALIRPSSWLPLVRRPRITRQAIEALVVAVLYELFATRLFGSYAMLAGPAMFAVIGLSWMTTERARRIILLALGAAVVCGLSIAAISAPWRAESVPSA
jgi:hypothetical protein